MLYGRRRRRHQRHHDRSGRDGRSVVGLVGEPAFGTAGTATIGTTTGMVMAGKYLKDRMAGQYTFHSGADVFSVTAIPSDAAGTTSAPGRT